MRATLDHPLLELNKLLLDEMKQLRDLGVYVGTYCQPMIPSLYQPVADPMETIRTIQEIGPDRCIIGSDFGQVLHMDAVDGMRVFIRALARFRHQAGRGQGDAERQSGETDVVGKSQLFCVQNVQTVQVVQNDPRLARLLERFERLELLFVNFTTRSRLCACCG